MPEKWKCGKENVQKFHVFYCRKAAELFKPLGILALIVPQCFQADSFSDRKMIRSMEAEFSFLGQIGLPEDAFSYLGVARFGTKIQLWQRKSGMKGWTARRYKTELEETLGPGFDSDAVARRIFEKLLRLPKADLEQNKSRLLLELAKEHQTSKGFAYETRKLLYQIQTHPATRDKYTKCCKYLCRFYTQKQPIDISYEHCRQLKRFRK